jgi:hypothetical protein
MLLEEFAPKADGNRISKPREQSCGAPAALIQLPLGAP